MAVLISGATGNFTDAATWGLSDPTSLLDSELGNTANTTAYVESATFTPGAITIDGIAVKLASREASPTGTATVRLALGGSDVVGTPTTIDVVDLPTCTVGTNEGGWLLFRFAAPVLLLAATAYTVSIRGSTSAQFNLYRNATAGNWSRQLRTTTTLAPVATDILHVMGEHTGPATGNNIIVTMNQTATTDYGAGTDNVPCLTVSQRGSFIYGVAASTNYYLRVSGDIIIYNHGVFSQGSLGAEIPRSSTAVLEFDPVADGGMGFRCRNGGTYNSYGLSRTIGKDIIACALNTDEAVNSTSLGVNQDTGWLDNDVIVVAKTSRDGNERTERGLLNGNAGVDTLTVNGFAGAGGGLQFSHTGTNPVQADVCLLTRNVRVRSASSSIMTFVSIGATAIVVIRWTQFSFLGENVGGRRGIEISTTTGVCDIQYCSIHDTEDCGLFVGSSSGSNITFSYNVMDRLNTAVIADTTVHCVFVNASSGVTTMIGNYFFRGTTFNNGTSVVRLNDIGITFIGNTICDFTQGGLTFFENGTVGSNSGNRVSGARTPNGYAVVLGSVGGGPTFTGGVFGSFTSYLNNSEGIITPGIFNGVTLQDFISFGNTTSNFVFGGVNTSTAFTDTVITNLVCHSISGFSTLNGVSTGATTFINTTLSNSSIGVVSGVRTAHTNDISAGAVAGDLLVSNCTFGSPTLVSNNGSIGTGGRILFRRLQNLDNNHRWYTRFGFAQSTGAGLTDTTVRTSGSLALRINPINTVTGFLYSYRILARAGTAIYANGFLRKNTAFGTSVVTVELFLPGSTVADSTYTMSNTTEAWEAFIVNATYTGTLDLYATVIIRARTITASAFLYVDDLYNGTNKITALDVWENGQPSPIMFEQLGDAAAVWAVATTGLTTAGTTGDKLTKLLEIGEFIALK